MKKIQVKFETQYDLNLFNKKLNIEITKLTKKVEYPTLKITNKRTSKSKKRSDFCWEDYWIDMPNFTKEKGYFHAIDLVFTEDLTEELENKLGYAIPTGKNKSIWFCNRHHRYKGKFFTSNNTAKNKYPIFIPSKGRWDCCKTAQYLVGIGVENFYIVVEEQEYDNYAAYFDTKHLLVLPESYQKNYDALDDFGMTRSKGSGPARNFIWDTSIDLGYEWTWIIDDNVSGFVRFAPGNFRIPMKTPVFFDAAENFITRFKNVAMGSLNYRFFCVSDRPAFQVNTRMYSIILIRNNIPFRWTGRYNEDTILSLNVLKAGWKTIMLNSFLGNKAATQTVKGGNTDELYKDGTAEKSQMLKDAHPDEVELVERWGRPHHFIDYKKHWADHSLEYEDDFNPTNWEKINEYEMYLSPDKICLI